MLNRHQKYCLVVLLFSLSQSFAFAGVTSTPTKLSKQMPQFNDDLNWANMELAINRQVASFDEKPNLSQQVRFGNDIYTLADLKASAQLFLKHVKSNIVCQRSSAFRLEVCNDVFNRNVYEDFNIYEPVPSSSEPGYGTDQPTKFTAYYSPELEGSLTPNSIYKNPIYALPSSEGLRTLTREEIDFQNGLRGKGLELVWVKEDLFQLYLLQVQGGGRVRVRTKAGEEKYYLSYAGGNGQPFKFISKYMVQKGLLSQDNVGIEAQEACIKNNPQEERNIFSYNTNYVYFKFTDHEPVGIENIPLTEGRSAALDVRIYKNAGIINYFETYMPVRGVDGKPVMQPFSRFFIAQDTGGAIKGNARVDMYFGFGEKAGYVAYNTNVQGKQFFLVKKKIRP